MTQDTLKHQVLDALYAWIRQRPGLDYGNYGDPVSYRAELRQIQKDLHHARTLLRGVELSSISGEQLLAAFRAYCGRMTWRDGHLAYCTGQYWPTEYRKVVAAIAAEALWEYTRSHCMPQPVGDTAHGLSAGEWLRQSFRKEYGKAIQSRWFD